jgi:hypothetical protein
MSKKKQLYDILNKHREGEVGTDRAHIKIMRLFDNDAISDWKKWEDCILSFLRENPKVREDFNKHVDDWNTHTPLPPSAYEQ